MKTVSRAERVARIVVVIVGIFLIAAAVFSGVMLLSLLAPGTPLDALWAMKAGSRSQFLALGFGGPALLGGLVIVLAPTGVGMLRRWRWARWVAILVLAVNVIPDLIRGVAGETDLLLPIVPVAVVMVYLALPVVGRTFRHAASTDARMDS